MVQPDVIGTITNMNAVEDVSVDSVFSSHNIEHLYAHEVPIAFAEFSCAQAGRIRITDLSRSLIGL